MVPGIIRTIVPVMVGSLLAWILIHTGIDLGPFTEGLSEALVVFLTGVWYILFRYLERNKSKWWGWLLGLAAQPIYPDEAEDITPNVHTPATVKRSMSAGL